jgi:hypothetical protein
MSKLIATIVLGDFTLQPGQVAGDFKVVVLDGSGTAVKTQTAADVSTPVEIDVTDLAAGNYTVSASRTDSSGADVTTAVSASFTIPDSGTGTGTTTQVPTSVTVQLQ